ncbi:hypothetical protein [Citrobacter sp. JGM124]|uniref:hypothetical protein n=1 Tax=Citrobacter sp. JGM124 TaxID=2799789 RepID=UPI001BA94CCD|nr:hypothetical protein [Citrobacter sp. JGM124]MBS0849868.1 hypothetical protein [Citrobacter sp. JGM124]
MYELTLKRRVGIFLGVVFLFIPLSLGGLYLFIDSFFNYFSFPDSFVFTSAFIYGLTGFFILFSMVFLSIKPIFLGKQFSLIVQYKVNKFMIACLIFSFVFQVIFFILFTDKLNSLGYIACKGTPIGWTPGMGTKYVTAEVLCSKKDP